MEKEQGRTPPPGRLQGAKRRNDRGKKSPPEADHGHDRRSPQEESRCGEPTRTGNGH